ncbi:TrkA C-terminal domain-containing protein [Halocalculus aciditolerans]|uniref:RCK C-terminal domain-containing protein n=1 Tax=Halocalculus aciditolerans TaxID=1383812 RepID=A0A830F911_9EURY|nr:TrkA C-terminal domain-containing protein [Halocalculus aciditolerans]GGL51565.1 hypothetical protein GCM10009039_07310 [Halocalculus aciditolerans]
MVAVLGIDVVDIARIVGLSVLAGLTAAVVAFVYRVYFRDRVATGITVLAAISSVALYLNTKTAFAQVMQGQTDLLEFGAVVFNVTAFAAAVAVSPAGQRVGDRAAMGTSAFLGAREIEGDVGQIVQAVGRVVAVEVPDTIHDIDSYDPVTDEVKAEVAGKTFLFPRRLTVEDLRGRVANRLKDDYDIGYVDVDLAADGTVEYIALGRRASGLGPTLGPGTAAAAVTADPPNAASPGDLVQVWTREEPHERVATGEIRGVAGDTVTLALDDQDAAKIAGNDYRLVTLPGEQAAERQFVSVLRAADETMAAVDIAENAALAGKTVADVETTVAAIRPVSGTITPIPRRNRALAAGDTLYVLGRPDAIRRVETAASKPDATAGKATDDA